MHPIFRKACLALGLALLFVSSHSAQAWWNPEWTVRKALSVDAGATGVPIKDALGESAVVLVRLHEGNFAFASAKEDGSDIRFVAADDKTPLAYHIERYDSLLNEAFVWVKVPALKPGAATPFFLYYGNLGEKAVRADDPKATFAPDTALAYHFSENAGAFADQSGNENKPEAAAPGMAVGGSLIAGGLRLTGSAALKIPASTSLEWKAGGALTWSAWIKPAALKADAQLFSRRGETGALLVIGESEGVPFVEVGQEGGAAALRSAPTGAGLPMAAGTWHHLAVVAQGGKVGLYLDGESYASLAAPLPALNSPLILGREATGAQGVTGFSGELDELTISNSATAPGALLLAFANQGSGDKAGKLLVIGADEVSGKSGGKNELLEQLSLFGDISKSLTFDGWVVIVLCALLAMVGWGVTIAKFLYLSKIKKATAVFREQWDHISSDLTALDHSDEETIRSMGGKATGKSQKLMRESPLFHIYHLGSQEISNRIANAKGSFSGLSERSIHAIRVTLDGGLFREVQRLNRNIVFLTIGIAGGPYLGLLGTVIGVMITFAVIAKSGEVEINSIAPGIAGALLATVAGLAVAIPALFAYSYISARIKDSIGEMQNFIEEFVAKIAEFYPSKD